MSVHAWFVGRRLGTRKERHDDEDPRPEGSKTSARTPTGSQSWVTRLLVELCLLELSVVLGRRPAFMLQDAASDTGWVDNLEIDNLIEKCEGGEDDLDKPMTSFFLSLRKGLVRKLQEELAWFSLQDIWGL